ncbi:MAG: nuclear transport factor 2 family protein [Lachnospiraceae bacterium]|jgi:hypothetical protein|nr:nuclear transport factor 2 family protein [Lachnospiraceae bacterium]
MGLEQRLERLESEMARMGAEIDRCKAVTACANLIGRYINFHSASMEEESYELFAKQTPGTLMCIDGWGVYLENEGVRRFFCEWLKFAETESEAGMAGRLYRHDISTPLIVVAKDGQTAKGIWSSLGAETCPGTNGRKFDSVWCLGTYEGAFVLEDGEWRIWKLMFRDTLMTPFDGEGWTVTPVHPAYADHGEHDDLMLPPAHLLPDIMTREKHMRPLSLTEASCSMHDCIPYPPQPYDTWDDSLFTKFE